MIKTRLSALFSKAKPAASEDESIAFEGDFRSYEEAQANCRGSAGYESDAAVERYIRRHREVAADPGAAMMQATEQVLRFMAAFSLARPIDGVYRVYDFGGGYGAIYEIFRFLYPDKQFHWTIVEVPALVARASEMGASANKVFCTQLVSGRYSFGISSGTLQYLPDPHIGLRKMVEAGAELTMVNRFPIVEAQSQDRLTVQHVPSAYFEASFPAWFFAPAWREKIKELGEPIASWASPGDEHVLDGHGVSYGAFLMRKRFT